MAEHALGRAAAEDIQDVAVTCRGHADQIDVELDGHVDDRACDITRTQHHLWRAT